MKIENLLLNSMYLSNKEEIFKEGTIFKGKVIELLDNMVIIDIRGQGTLQAALETDLKIKLGDEISFLVKEINENAVHLKPLNIDESFKVYSSNDNKDNNPIIKLLRSINIKETKLSIGLAENLMRYNAPITEQNLTDGIRTLEKLFQLFNLKDEEKVILLNSTSVDKNLKSDEFQIIKENITTPTSIKTNKQPLIQDDILENHISPEKTDIKSLLVINKDDYNESKDLSQLVKEFLGNEIHTKPEDEYIKIISFLLKNNIKPSLNNIKNLRELNENPIEFVKELKLIDKILNKFEFDDMNRILSKDTEVLNIKNIVPNKDEEFIELQKSIRNLFNIEDLKLKEDIKSLSNKIDFLREINKDLSFIFFPINHREKELDGILTLIKENNKKKNYNEKTNIYINVETYNLGNVKVSCQLVSNSLLIRMNVKDEDLELFKSTEKQLIEKISLIGYSLDRIEFVVDNNIGIIDTIVSNPNPTYILDLKV